MELVNKDKDFHMHTLNFSDGFSTIDELVQYAAKKGLKEIAITDHSDATIEYKGWIRNNNSFSSFLHRWRNVHNDVVVNKGVEADLLDKQGDICATIKGVEPDFSILSVHRGVYRDDPSSITEGLLNAIGRHAGRIRCLAHLDHPFLDRHLDLPRVIEAANKHNIIIELNATNLHKPRTDHDRTRMLLDVADRVMVNSDAHVLADLDNREAAFSFLKEQGYIKSDDNP